MRIALITPEYPGCGPSFGVGRYVRMLADGLAAAGHAVLVLAACDQGGFTCIPGHAPRRDGPRIPRLLARPLLAASWMSDRIEAFGAEVAEASNWGSLGAWLPERIPLVTRLSTSSGEASMGTGGVLGRLRLAQERRAVRRSDLVIADSAAMARSAIGLYGREPERVLMHAWDGETLPVGPRSGDGVLFVGRLEPRKGPDVLLAAWPRVLARRPDAVLHLVGRDLGGAGPADRDPPGVIRHGMADDRTLAGLRAVCRVAAVPSRFESFGMVVLESWAAGLAVACCDGGALQAVVGDAGVVTPRGDPESLALGVLAALDRSRALAAAGQERLRRHFGMEPWIAGTVEAYRSALDRRRLRM